MNHRVSTLAIAAMLAGAALPASAQYTNNFEATNNPGALASATDSSYTVSTQASATRPNYVKESGNAVGTTGNTDPMFLNEGSSQGASYNYTPGANYTALVSTAASTTGTAINGKGTFISGQIANTATGTLNSTYNPTAATYQSNVQAFSGSQSLLVSYVQNNTATTSFYRLQTVNVGTDALARPTIDLGGTISFMVYFDTGLGTGTSFAAPNTTPLVAGTSTLGVEIATNQTSAGTSLGAFGGTNQGSLYVLGSTAPGNGGTSGATGTGSGTFPLGGHSVTNGSWQKVTFNLSSEAAVNLLGTTTPRATSGLGILNDIDFTTSGVAGQSFNIYIDDITFTPAPEPSEWAAMGLGAAGLLGLALRARRRNAGPMAA